MLDVIEKFLTADSTTQVYSLLTRQCGELGFDHCIYAPLFGGQGSQKVFKDESAVLETAALIAHDIFTDCPPSWQHRYQVAKHFDRDPVIKHVCRSTLPIFWDDAGRSDPGNIVLDEARDHGLAWGITVTVYGHGGQRSVLRETDCLQWAAIGKTSWAAAKPFRPSTGTPPPVGQVH